MPASTPPTSLASVRRFNRFYTSKIGVLGDHIYQSPYSLAQVRVLYEVANRERPTATELIKELGIDPGYMSRILRGLEKDGLLRRKRSRNDARHVELSLTARGRKTFAGLDAGSNQEVSALLKPLDSAGQAKLLGAFATIEDLLAGKQGSGEAGKRAEESSVHPSIRLSDQAGDLGWIVATHGELYDREYGWDQTFEALVAEIVAKFGKQHDAARERCWIAELEGERVGCVMCCKESEDVARLRLLLVHPKARGASLGTRLVEECMSFARQAGYRQMVLWTNDVLVAARRIYEKSGFRLVEEEGHRSFGHELVGQTWEATL